MRVHIGGDHAAYDLKVALVEHLRSLGVDVVDHGPTQFDPEDDYPRFVIPAAEAVLADEGSLGVVLGGSGNGEQIAANKVRGIRAALAHSLETAELARQHNNAQVVAIGARMTDIELAKQIVEVFLESAFVGGDRHARRLALLDTYEETGTLPPA